VKLKITVDGQVYEVEVEVSEPEAPHPGYYPPVPGQLRVPAAPSGAALGPGPGASAGSGPVADESKVCRSPLAGFVSRISAQVGQSIQPNDVLLVLEAMKMETTITAPAAGKVSKLNVNTGDTVVKGQVLVEFE
jgi:methylmalonyl-CoA carboxyltransferase small subunit